MAHKTQEKITAQLMYVHQLKTGAEIAAKLNVTEATISKWKTDGGWEEERNARLNSHTKNVENIKQLIADLTEQRIQLIERKQAAVDAKDTELVHLLNKEAIGIADELSKWNKALFNMDNKHRYSLEIYLEIMDRIFTALQAYDMSVYMSTLDFQSQHVQEASKNLGK